MLKHWLLQVVIALNQLVNALIGGMADETMSARAHRQRLKGRPLMATAINALFFWEDDHCLAVYENEMARGHMPGAYRSRE